MDSPVILDNAPEFGQYVDRAFPGFPFDDDGFERRGNIRSHLDDLAARHPEFADQLLGPPWGDAPFLTTPRNRRRGSGLGNNYQNHPDDDARSQASGSSAASAASGASGVSSHGEPEPFGPRQEEIVQEQRKNPIPQYGLRNTVDIGQHRHNMDNNEKMNRGQRSASAPPAENRQANPQQQQYQEQPMQQQEQYSDNQQHPQNQNQRFVSRVDITPQQQQQQQQDSAKPPTSPKQQNQPQQSQPQSQTSQQQQKAQQQQQHGNVRHIPIFVEGRDEPVVPKNVDEPIFTPQQQRPPSPPQFHRPSHFNQHFTKNRQQWPPQYHQQPQFFQQHPHHEQQQTAGGAQQQNQKPNHYQQQQQQYRQQQAEKQRAQQQEQQQQQQQEAEPAPKLKQIQPKEPLERVALVQQEVDSLMEEVKKYSGKSRQEKEYMYLDEMLTRELIKLDDIETEGKPNVRQARKNAIKSIQDCISLLESKVPLPGQEVATQEQVIKEDEKPQAEMETDLPPMESEASKIPEETVQPTPIPLPPGPSAEQNSTGEESTQNQEQITADQSINNETSSPSVIKTDSSDDRAMETQQGSNIEGQKRQAESSPASLIPAETGSEQQMDVDNNTVKANKSPRKERKTKAQKPVSEQPIPLPAPEVCDT